MSEDVTVKLRVDDTGAARKGHAVADSLEDVAAAGGKAVSSAKAAKKEFVEVAGAFTALAIARQVRDTLLGLASVTDEVAIGMGKVNAVLGENQAMSSTFKNVIQTAATATGKSFGDIATVVRDLIAQGFNPALVANEDFITSLTKFQRIAEISSDQVGNLAKGLGNMGFTGAQVVQALDRISAIADESALNMGDFTAILSESGAVASNMGQDFDSLAKTAALVSTSFQKGQVEATALKNTLVFLGKSDKAGKLKDMFGVDTIDAATGQLKKLPQLLLEMSNAIPEEKLGALNDIFGTRSGAIVLQTALRNLRKGMAIGGDQLSGDAIFERLGTILEGSAGAVDKKFEKMTDNMADQLARLEQAGKGVITGFLGPFLGMLTTVIGGIATFIGSVNEFLASHPTFATFNGILLGIVGTTVLLGTVFMTLIAGTRLLRFAIQFVKNETVGLRLGLMGTVSAARMASAQFGVMAGVATVARAGVNGLRASLVGLKAGMGPIGWILLAIEAIVMFLPHIISFFGGKDKHTMQLDKTVDKQGIVVEKLASTGAAFGEITEKLGKIVDEFTGKSVKDFPVFDPRAQKVLSGVLSKAGALDPTLLPEQLEGMNDVFGQFMQAAKTNQQTPEQFDRAVIALQQAIGFAAMQEKAGIAGAGKNKKALVDFLEQMKQSVSPEMALFMRRREALSTPGASIYGAAPGSNDVVSMPDTAGAGRGQMMANQGIVIAKLPDNASFKQTSFQSATVQNMQFNGNMTLSVDGQPLRAAIKSGNIHDEAANMGGR